MREIDMIVIHCSASRCDRDYSFEALDRDHRSWGWNGCGYHRYITEEGGGSTYGGRRRMRPTDAIELLYSKTP